MAPIDGVVGRHLFSRNATDSRPEANPATDLSDAAAWSGSFTLASVDLIAMIVSDAGLSSSSPEWWNCSPLGCLLIGIQPRGGWQVMQRAVQWGDGYLSRAFGIKCDTTDLFQYFACSTRNRLEVWDSKDFFSPTQDHEKSLETAKRNKILHSYPPHPVKQATKSSSSILPCFRCSSSHPSKSSATAPSKTITNAKPKPSSTPSKSNKSQGKGVKTWRQDLKIEGRGCFQVRRPTKLLEGSKGGPAFMCSILVPPAHEAYSISQQARMQMLSVFLVTAGLTNLEKGEKPGNRIWRILERDMGMNPWFSSTFDHFRLNLVAADILVLCYVVFSYYCLFRHNYFHSAVSYAIQMASLVSWSTGAIGLLALGGNPRVKISSSVTNIPRHILKELFVLPIDFFSSPDLIPVGDGDVEREKELRLENALSKCRTRADSEGKFKLEFGYLQSTHYTPGDDTCTVFFEELKQICGLRMTLFRPVPWWYIAFFWFVAHLLASIALQIFGADVATLGSQLLGVFILISTSLLRGAGIAGPEEWMIPRFKMRDGAHYGANLLSKTESRKT